MRHNDVIEVPDSVDDISKWARATCPCCGQVSEMRWVGLRTVAATGDENHAEKQWRPPVFVSPQDGPFVVQEVIDGNDRPYFVATDPTTGITCGGKVYRQEAETQQKAMNAAYWLGRSHESHDAGKVVQAARDVHATRQDDVCGDAPHSVHIDTNAAIALADAIEWYDGQK